MAIYVETDDPQHLLDLIYDGINDGTIVTWAYDEDGCFTHATPQWQYQAWLNPQVQRRALRLTIIAPEDRQISVEAYAVYHGRFAEMLLANFDNLFSEAHLSALPEVGDDVDGDDE